MSEPIDLDALERRLPEPKYSNCEVPISVGLLRRLIRELRQERVIVEQCFRDNRKWVFDQQLLREEARRERAEQKVELLMAVLQEKEGPSP